MGPGHTLCRARGAMTDTSGDPRILRFAPGDWSRTISDFSAGTDLIDLSVFPEIASISDLTIACVPDGVTIDLAEYGGGTIVLPGLAVENLDGGAFRFAERAWQVAFVYATGANVRLPSGSDDELNGVDSRDRIGQTITSEGKFIWLVLALATGCAVLAAVLIAVLPWHLRAPHL